MDEIFNYLNETYEAGRSILNGRGKIDGYAFDGYAISGLFHLDQAHISFQITNGPTPETGYVLELEHDGQKVIQEDLSGQEIIQQFQTGNLPHF
ncbi:hypothetical protein [Spirosoma koreense]